MKKKYSQGYSLLELLFVIVILGGIMILEMQKKNIEFYQLSARNLGVEVFRIASGIEKWMAANSGLDAPPVGVNNGVNWLKSPSCGGTATGEFVQCNFLNSGVTTFGKLGIKTTIENPSKGVLTSITVFDDLVINGKPDYALSGIAAMVASGSWYVGQADPSLFSTDSIIKFCVTASTIPECSGNVGKIIIVSSTQSFNEKYLRVDHGNNMQNIIEFDAAATGVDENGLPIRQIRNVARIYNEGDSGFDSLILGKAGGAVPPTVATAGVIVDADQAIIGKLDTFGDIKSNSGNIYATGTPGAGGNIEADVDLKAGRNANIGSDAVVGSKTGGSLSVLSPGSLFDMSTMKPGDIRADTDVLIGQDLKVGRDVEVERDVFIHGNTEIDKDLDVKGIMYGQLLIDRNDMRYMIDPNQVSVFEKIQVSEVSALKMGGANSGILSLRGDKVKFGSWGGLASNDETALEGNVDVANLNVKVSSGKFVSLDKLLPNMVFMDSYSVTGTAVIKKPSCGTGGTPKIILVPQVVEMGSVAPIATKWGGVGIDEAYGLWQVWASSSGTSWIVGSESAYYNGTQSSAIAETYCTYR